MLFLTVIAAGFGLAWQTGVPALALSGLGPYLLWICLTPSKALQARHQGAAGEVVG